MYIIPIVRSSRAIAACTILPQYPLIAIGSSEIISYIVPFIKNSPLNSINDMLLFYFYYLNYNESAVNIIEQFKNKYISYYILESISIFIYLFFYFANFYSN